MGKIIITECGNEKTELIKVLREITGLGLKETKQIVDTVEDGEAYTIEVNSGFEDVAVKKILATGALARTLSYDFVLKEEKEFSEEESFEFDTSSPQGREETLKILGMVGKIVEKYRNLDEEITNLKSQIDIEKAKAEKLRSIVSSKAKTIRAVIVGCALITGFVLPIILTIILTIVVLIIVNVTVVQQDLKEHEEENNANAEKYIIEHVNPLIERLENAEKEFETLIASGKIEWAKDIVGEEMFDLESVRELYNLVKGRRADTLKEALNLYEDIKYKERMEKSQAAIQTASEISAAEAVKQTEYSKEVAKNSYKTAKAAKQSAYNTKQIEKNTRIFR